jgi:hypothetical protein
MWGPGRAAVTLCVWLIVLLTISDDALAQSGGGPRMGFPSRGPIGGQLRPGAPPGRPPRLALPPSTDPGRGRRPIYPYQYFDWYGYGYYDDTYLDDSTDYYYEQPDSARQEYPSEESDSTPETSPARELFPVDDPAGVGPLQVSLEPMGSRTMARLTWRDEGASAAQVAFFLADSTRAVLSARTVRSSPFTALLEPTSKTAFAGMTVVLPGGTLVTQFLDFDPRP